MFQCERCGSRYSAIHAATIENCPRCLIRDRTPAPLAFSAFARSAGPTGEDRGTLDGHSVRAAEVDGQRAGR